MHDCIVRSSESAAKEQLDALISRFFEAFDNTEQKADLSILHELFLPQAIIVNNTAEPAAFYTTETFIPPRQEMFDIGTLKNFKEWEIDEETAIFGRVAHRRSLYGKSGTMYGKKVDCQGHKSFQFVHTEGQWRISALSWWDEVA